MNNQYLATPPTIPNGGSQNPQCDVLGNMKTTLATKIAGEDVAADVMKTEEQWLYATITTATTTLIKTGAGVIGGIEILGGTLGAITVFDNTSAANPVIAPTFTPTAAVPIQPIAKGARFNTGLTIVTAAATVILVKYR